MSNKLYYDLYPSDGIPPRLYGQIKAHKQAKDYPMRTIVSTVGSPAYKVSAFLVKIIQPTLNKNEVRITNSSAFTREIKDWNVSQDEIQVSYDVVALYPSVPIKKATTTMLDLLRADFADFKSRTNLTLDHIKSLIDLCLENSYFLWNEKIYKLIDSGPIGLSLMVVMAEGFLQVIEKNAINIAVAYPVSVAPITHRRYVDDTHDRFLNKEDSEEFLRILNAQDPHIQFEPEYENEDKELNFLDCSIMNTGEGRYQTKVYRKDAITNVQIKSNSDHDEKIKDGIFKGFLHRARTLCTEKYLADEIEFLIDVFVENGYRRKNLEKLAKTLPTRRDEVNDNTKRVSLPFVSSISKKLKKAYSKAGLKTVFKSGRTLETILSSRNKPTLSKNSSPGCYRVPCECGGNYIGQTKKQIRSRLNEHQKAIFTGNITDSALSEHSINCSYNIDWEKASSISTENNYRKRCVREALEIQRESIGPRKSKLINRESGLYVTTNSWHTLFNKINTAEEKKQTSTSRS